jgi:crotonobetainyl-CoA:carnitine CoA-transferase CaiB-like acyl-CoA transferase
MLEGMRIVDLTTVVFGPYATQSLADLGADVIKVETPQGDVTRWAGRPGKTPGMGPNHLNLNRGKRSIVLDLKDEADRRVMRDLLATADVFVHNVRAEAISRLGFNYESVRDLKRDIIYVHCVGFGSNGPYAPLQAYDDLIQAASGTATLASRVDGNPRPRYVPSLIADKVAGLYGANAILAAIVHKLRTGNGQFVEVPMFEVFTHFMLKEHLFGAVFDRPGAKAGYPRQLDPGRQPFLTKDGWISIVAYTDDSLCHLLKLLGRSEVLTDERFATVQARLKRDATTRLYEIINEATPEFTTQALIDLCRKSKPEIPAMAVRDLQDVLTDPHLLEAGFFKREDHPTEGPIFSMMPPVRFNVATPPLRPAPLLGQHSQEIRHELAPAVAPTPSG